MKNSTLLLTLLLLSLKGQAQDIIHLENSSFEDTPRCCQAPQGWHSCGSPEESPPDIQPGSFDVNLPPKDGETYLGMVVRDNNRWESLSQRLPEPLEAGKSYLLTAYLARSERFLSISRLTGEEVNFTTPVKLRVWGGHKHCDNAELLAESSLITQTEWQNFELALKPQNQYEYLLLEAYYNESALFAYNGNLLVDKLELLKLKE